jgi:acyl-CoA reductase-like NAD-dependent aldehyde dehydrogenase
MNPEAAEAIRIADKHLAGRPPHERRALALDIIQAINRYAGIIAAEVVSEGIKIAGKAPQHKQ